MFGNMNNNVFYRVLFPLAVYFVLFNMLFTVLRYMSDNMLGGALDVLYCAAISGEIGRASCGERV